MSGKGGGTIPSKLMNISIEVVENGWVVELERIDETGERHVFTNQTDLIALIDNVLLEG